MTTNMDISRSKHAPASACPHYKPPPQKMAGSLKLDAVGSRIWWTFSVEPTFSWYALPETNSSPLKIGGWETGLLKRDQSLGKP